MPRCLIRATLPVTKDGLPCGNLLPPPLTLAGDRPTGSGTPPLFPLRGGAALFV